MVAKIIDAAWPLCVAIVTVVAYVVFSEHGWTRGESAAFASIAAFLTPVVILIVDNSVPRGNISHLYEDFSAAALTSFATALACVFASITATVSWPIITCVGVFMCIATTAYLCSVSDHTDHSVPTIGEGWLIRKTLLPVAILAGFYEDWASGIPVRGLMVCVVVLLIQFFWTVLRWPKTVLRSKSERA